MFSGAGGNEVVSVRDRPDPRPRAFEVLVGVRYAGLNPADLMQRDGHYPAPPGSPADIPGLEVAGTVIEVGEAVGAVHVGQRVFGIVGGGGLADRVAAHESVLASVPDVLTDLQAAAVPEAFFTAHDAIRTQADLVMGETLVVHGATGGVGTAAVQLGVAAGARVLGVVRRPEAADHVRRLGAEPITDATFVDEVLAATDGKGADVILELVGAVHFPHNLNAGAIGARIVVVGTGVGAEAAIPLRLLGRRRQSIRGTVLRARSTAEKAQVALRFAREVRPSLATGAIQPVVESVYPVDAIRDALDALAAPGRSGKLLIDFSR